ncbi:TIGR02300 family protein [Phenylobacterium sp.]|uniref:TIGR02300 family protein n=1 Tax=Phenylobacterium sp. TaxID=1871053 RepID=UPI0011F8F48C|nr:TIGR02300 family protein [Phenylobacterium sp.]TAL34108.1 MAG: TIGR02300 family protein [Phenylobacterium sp.]
MANPELGTKQICPNCQAKFYDLGKRPAHCPKCAHEFDPDEAVRNRRVRARTIVPDDDQVEDQVADKDADEDEEEDEAVTPELDEVVDEPPLVTDDDDTVDEPGAGAVSEDLGEFTDDDAEAEDDDVPFLEDEDEDDFDDSEIEGLPGEGDEDR